ncbi:hypothetical protein M885DRAFT_521132 [Pelagophyceae sp. CCMP2097]|nr:hypothetical protein M885DRAFT_521132 [Pelagophyceae sp. CCMP2097]
MAHDVLAMICWGMSVASVFPPFGPRFLAGDDEALKRDLRKRVLAWGYVCAAAAIGERLGRLLGRIAARWLAGDNVRGAVIKLEAVALLCLHVGLGGSRSVRHAVSWRVACSVVAASAAQLSTIDVVVWGQRDAEQRRTSSRLIGVALGSAAPLFTVGARRVAKLAALLRHAPLVALAGGAASALIFFLQACRRARRRRLDRAAALPEYEDELDAVMDAVPALYIETAGATAGARRWQSTVAWRAANDVASVLHSPQPKYNACKMLYPHSLHGVTREGERVIWELLGNLDTSFLRSGEVSIAEAFRHFLFVHEFCSWHFEGEETRLVTVMDVQGLRLKEVNALFFRLVGTASDVLNNLMPFRVRRIVVINAPSWFHAAWRGVQRVLPRELRDKVQIVGTDYAAALDALCDRRELPQEYGGDKPLGHSDDELAMLEAACVLNAGKQLASRQPAPEVARPAALHDVARPPVERPSNTAAAAPWWRRLVGGGAGAGPRAAFLGSENKFYYSESQQRWLLDDADADAEAGEGQAAAADDDDDEMILAIQAATLRRALSTDAQLGSLRARTTADLWRTLPESFAVPRAYAAAPPRAAATGDGDGAARPWLVALLYLSVFVACACRGALCAVGLPWIVAPVGRGGLGLRRCDAAAVAVAAAALLALLAARAPRALAAMPRVAPLRAFRVGAGLQGLVLLALPQLPTLASDGLLPRGSPTVVVVLVACAVIVSVNAHFAVAAARASLDVAGRATRGCAALHGAELCGDVAGTLGAALLVREALRQKRPFPCDVSLGLTVTAIASAALYALSLLVYKQVIGDVALGRAPATNCMALLELPARDVQRCVDDAIEADEATS